MADWTSDTIPKNIMETLVVDDLAVNYEISAGTIQAKNAATAWVNFDGTTTPPTIRDSFNVSDVVRTATGTYYCYFASYMDNTNFAVSSTFKANAINDSSSARYASWVSGVTPEYFILEVGYESGSSVGKANFEYNYAQIFGGKN